MAGRASIILTWAIRIACLAAVLLPLFTLNTTLYPFVFPRIIAFEALVIGIIFLIGLLFIVDRQYKPIAPFNHPIVLYYAIFLFLLGVSALFGVDPERSFWSTHERMTGIIFLGFFFLWFLVLLLFFQTKKQFQLLFAVSVITSCVVGIIGLFEGFQLNSFFGGEPFVIRSTLGNPLYVGVYALLHIILAIYLGITEERRAWLRRLYYFSASFNFFILFVSAARGPMFAFLLSSAVFCFFLFRSRWHSILKKGYFFSIPILIGLILIGMLLYSPTGQELGKRVFPYTLTKTLYYSYDGFFERIALWRIGLEGFIERPFLGWGWENFDRVYELHYRPVVGEGRLRDPWINRSHSQYIDILSLGGIFAFIAYGLFWFYTFRLSAKKFLHVEGKEKYGFAVLFLFFLAYFIQNISGFDTFSSLIVYIPVLAFLIVIPGPDRGSSPHERCFIFLDSRVPRLRGDGNDKSGVIQQFWTVVYRYGIGVFLIAASFFMAFFVVVKPFEKSYYANKGLDAVYQYQFENGARFLKKVFGDHIFFEREARYLLANYLVRAIAAGALLPEHTATLSYFTSVFDKGLRENSDRYRDNVIVASLYKLLAERGDAAYLTKGISYGEKARSIAPRHQVAYHELADLYALAGDLDRAYEMAEHAVKLDPKNSYSHFVLSFQALKKGDLDIAFKELQIAQDFKYPVYQEISYISVLVSKLPEGKEYPKAIAYIDRAVEFFPGDVNYALAQIALYYKAGRQEDAIKFYTDLRQKLTGGDLKMTQTFLKSVVPSFSF